MLGKHALLMMTLSLQAGCANRAAISFNSQPEATLGLASWDKLDEPEPLGKTPMDVPTEKLKGKVLIISAPDRLTQYWFMPDDIGRKMQVNLTLPETPQKAAVATVQTGEQKEFDINKYSRLILKTYRAVLDGDLALAHELASKARQIAPKDSAPEILSGLAFLREGKTPEARTAFSSAKALAPDDQEVDELMRLGKESLP